MVNSVCSVRFVWDIGSSDLSIIWNLDIGIWDFNTVSEKEITLF